jgi:HEAT repeat protein
VGLLALGDKAQPHVAALQAAVTDDSPFVRITAAEALARLGETEASLPILGALLAGDDAFGRLYSAVAAKYLGPTAAPLVPQAKQAMTKKGHVVDMYTPWALQYFLSFCP